MVAEFRRPCRWLYAVLIVLQHHSTREQARLMGISQHRVLYVTYCLLLLLPLTCHFPHRWRALSRLILTHNGTETLSLVA